MGKQVLKERENSQGRGQRNHLKSPTQANGTVVHTGHKEHGDTSVQVPRLHPPPLDNVITHRNASSVCDYRSVEHGQVTRARPSERSQLEMGLRKASEGEGALV